MIFNEDLVVEGLSDVHFFHRKTKPQKMLSSIRELYPDNEETAKINLLAITGDFFDRLVTFEDPDIYYPIMAARHLLGLCKKHDIVLRLLKGTNLHDRGQNHIFGLINDSEGYNVDFKYVDTLSIEYIERFDINVLYLPDEWTHKSDLTFKQVTDLIHSRGLNKVDLALVHGGCTYQLPGVDSPALHDAVAWSEIVNLNILAGHIHTHSRYLKWVSVGSLERLKHAEEEAKGTIRVTYRNGEEVEFVRRYNHNAKIYRTIDVKGLGVNEVESKIRDDKTLVRGSSVRLEFTQDDPAVPITSTMREKFPELEISQIKTGAKKTSVQGSTFTQKRFEFTPITTGSVKPLLNQRWSEQKVSDDDINFTLTLIDEIMGGV